MSRAQRILQYIAGCTKPATLAEITAAVAVGEPRIDSPTRFNVTVAAQLCQLYGGKKVARHGVLGAFTYSATPLTLCDLRRVDRNGKPRKKSAQKCPKRAQPKPGPAPIARAVPRTLGKVIATQSTNQRLARANLGKPVPRRPGERETVEEFLARGGRIQKLAHGESSQPAYVDVRGQDLRAMRKRLQKAIDDDPANTDDDESVAA